MLSNATWTFTWGDLILFITMMVLFAELVKATYTSSISLVVPATSFGDIGAAGAAAGLCIAAHSFARACATGTHAIVASVSDRGEVSAIVVGAAGG
jgi:hypothetical protein